MKYSGAALPPKMQARGATGSRPSSAISRYISIDAQRREQLALVLVDALHLHVEQRVGVEPHAGRLRDHAGEARLVGALHVAERALELGVGRVRLELAQRLEVALPAVADARA